MPEFGPEAFYSSERRSRAARDWRELRRVRIATVRIASCVPGTGLQSPPDGAFVRSGRNGRMTRLPASQVREDFADTLNRVAFNGERILLHRHGKNVAALVPVADLEALEALEDRVDLTVARKALREKGTVALAALKARLRL